MEHLAEHDAASGRPEELRLSLEELEKAVNTTPAKGVPKPLFIAVAALAAVLALACGLLVFFFACQRHGYAVQLGMALDTQNAAQEWSARLEEELNRTKGELAQRETELSAAQDAIALLEEYSICLVYTSDAADDRR